MYYFLIYISKSTNPMPEEELLDILKVARPNNEKRNITGMLLYAKGLFIQLLEGDEDQVTQVFGKIGQDSRHYDIRVLIKGRKEERSYANWTMGFENLREDKDYSDIPGVNDFLRNVAPYDSAVSQPDGALNMLLNFKQALDR
jgi:hypothetical protein